MRQLALFFELLCFLSLCRFFSQMRHKKKSGFFLSCSTNQLRLFNNKKRPQQRSSLTISYLAIYEWFNSTPRRFFFITMTKRLASTQNIPAKANAHE
jgi:hypothetical protein